MLRRRGQKCKGKGRKMTYNEIPELSHCLAQSRHRIVNHLLCFLEHPVLSNVRFTYHCNETKVPWNGFDKHKHKHKRWDRSSGQIVCERYSEVIALRTPFLMSHSSAPSATNLSTFSFCCVCSFRYIELSFSRLHCIEKQRKKA